eukprot:2024255-Prymnesium_polylepis.1
MQRCWGGRRAKKEQRGPAATLWCRATQFVYYCATQLVYTEAFAPLPSIHSFTHELVHACMRVAASPASRPRGSSCSSSPTADGSEI